MDGFVTDYISVLTAEMGRQPTYDEYAQIMTGYTPEQMPVMSGSRVASPRSTTGSATSRRAPPNRSFFHAGSSSGFVVNMIPPVSFPFTTPPRRCSTGSTRPG